MYGYFIPKDKIGEASKQGDVVLVHKIGLPELIVLLVP
jgi:hypothetical protein